jgi:hypothetical protein
MNCDNCSRAIGSGCRFGDGAVLCIDCRLKRQASEELESRRNIALLNSLLGMWDWQTGYVCGVTPKFVLPPAPSFSFGDSMQINVENSNVGLINAGTIKSINSAVGLLVQSGEKNVAESLKAITDAVARSPDLDETQKNQAAEHLSLLADQAAKPPEQRTPRLIKGELLELAGLLGGIDALSSLWSTHGQALIDFFGM